MAGAHQPRTQAKAKTVTIIWKKLKNSLAKYILVGKDLVSSSGDAYTPKMGQGTRITAILIQFVTAVQSFLDSTK